MRSSRQNTEFYTETFKEERKSGKGAKVFIVIAVCILIYFICAGALGKWLSENVLQPVFGVFMQSEDEHIEEDYINEENTEAENTQNENDDEKQADSLLTAEEKITLPDLTVYALQTGVYTVDEYAKSDADSAVQKGGAGYIYDDGEVKRVMLCAYPTLDDAKNVQEALKREQGMETWEYEISAKGPDFKITASKEDIDAIKNYFQFVDNTHITIYETFASLDKNSITEDDAKKIIKDIETKIQEQAEKLENMSESGNETIDKMQEFNNSIKECLKMDENDKFDVEISRNLKYNYILYTNTYQNFLKELI